jgi:D-glycero-D-manno-heptose 1,7-bisphosphate phosphatase
MTARPALFLDRDGTLIADTGYIRSPSEVVMLPGAVEAVARAHRAGWAVVVVTNQSGIARGLMTEGDYQAVADEVARQVVAHGGMLDLQLHCPHLPELTGPCECRKPGLKLYREAIARLGIDSSRSWFIGDRLRDLTPARALGGHALHVQTGSTEDDVVVSEAAFEQVADLATAVERAFALR